MDGRVDEAEPSGNIGCEVRGPKENAQEEAGHFAYRPAQMLWCAVHHGKLIALGYNSVFISADDLEAANIEACPEDSNCPGDCYCEAGTVDCSHKNLKGSFPIKLHHA